MLVVRRRRRLQWNAAHDLEPVTFEPEYFLGVVRDQAHLAYAEIVENLRSDAVVALIDRQSKREIRFDGVRPAILKLVRAQLVSQPNAAAFLPKIEQYAATPVCDQLHSAVALRRTVAADGMQRVAGHAFGVDADEDLFSVSDLPHDQRDVRVLVNRRGVADAFPFSKHRRKIEFGDALDELFGAHPVRDKILYRDQPQAMAIRVRAQAL